MKPVIISLFFLLLIQTGYSQSADSVPFSQEQNKKLLLAAQKGDREAIRKALRKNANVNYQEPDSGMAAIHYLAIQGRKEDIRLLLQYGAYIDLVSHNGYAALHYACETGHLDTVRLLTGWGADVDTREEYLGRTPLYLASENGHLGIVRNLLFHEAKVNEKAYYRKYSALHIALENGHYDVADFLLQKGSFLNPWSVRHLTPLHWAAMDGNIKSLEWLLDKGASLDALSTEGYSALHLAVLFKQQKVVRYLIKKDINIELLTTKRSYGLPPKLSALRIAQIKKLTKIEAILKRAGAKSSIPNY